MEWSQTLIDKLDAALNEATVCGLRYAPEAREARLFIENWGMPEDGPVDPDPRRVLIMSPVSSLAVWLRPGHTRQPGDAITLDSFDALERFFQSLAWAHPMYGWSFVDDAEPWDPITGQPSLGVTIAGRPRAHTLRWFTECGRWQGSDGEPFLLAGVIEFSELDVRRADNSPIGAVRFAEDGARWWKAFRAHDERTGVDAQQQINAFTPHWRSQGQAGGILVSDCRSVLG